MSIAGCLREHVARLAGKMDLPVAFEGCAFIAPGGPWLACAVRDERERAAGLGRDAPLRVDGRLEIAVMALAGRGAGETGSIAARLAGAFPYGFGLDCHTPWGSGEIVFAAPKTGAAYADGGRVKVVVSIGFYAILFREEGQA